MANKCCVEWCNGIQNQSGKGYCRKHYDQMRKFGYILDKRSRCDLNRIEIDGDIARIIITDKNDKFLCEAIIDSEDVERVKNHRWTSNGKYIRCFLNKSPIYLHRFVLNYDGELDVDHINRNRLDNRKSNLRIVSRSLNNANKICKGYRYVDRNLAKPWFVRIALKDYVFSKYVATEEEAIKLAYEKKVELGIFL